jgi:hypothetical protein
MRTYGGVGYIDHVFLTSALVGCEWSASRPGRFTPGEKAPGANWIGGCVGPRTGLDNVERRKILPLEGLELRPLCRPAGSQWLYRLRYLGSWSCGGPNIKLDFTEIECRGMKWIKSRYGLLRWQNQIHNTFSFPGLVTHEIWNSCFKMTTSDVTEI